MRHVCYVSGSRADFGLFANTLQRAHQDPRLHLSVCVTGMHLTSGYGDTVRDIERSNLPIAARIPVTVDGSSGAMMARAIAGELAGFVDAFETAAPHMAVVLGDRGEMLAGALAAMHLGIAVVHVHGGERTGTVDEPVRHAISKLAHYHFVSTLGARDRLTRMGERAEHVFVTGAPGLDGITEGLVHDRSNLSAGCGFDSGRPIALMVFHPVLQESAQAGEQVGALLDALLALRVQALCLMPNSDAGGQRVCATLQRHVNHPDVRLIDHLPRSTYLEWLAAADVLVGNSSSGIIEAASFGLPVVNVGSRQDGRERSGNVIDASPERAAIEAALVRALKRGKAAVDNVYGDGRAGERIVELLATLPIDAGLLAKSNAY